MANIKISALTTYTGSAADIRWFVMNNSGNTETFKFSGYTSPFRPADGSNSIVASYLPTSRATGTFTLVGGEGTTTSNDNSSIVYGKNLNVINGGEPGKAVFGTGNVSNGGGNNLLFGTSSINNGYYSIAGGEGVNNYGNSNATFGRSNNNSGSRSFIAGNVNTITDGMGIFMMGMNHNHNTNGGYENMNSLIGGHTNTLNHSMYATIIGGHQNRLSGATSSFADYTYGSTIIGGTGNTLSANLSGIFGGRNNRIRTNDPVTYGFNYIIGGNSNEIGNNGARITRDSHIIGGQNNNIVANADFVSFINTTSGQHDGSGAQFVSHYNSSNCSSDGCTYSNVLSTTNTYFKGGSYIGIYNSNDCDVDGYGESQYITIFGSNNTKVNQAFPTAGGFYKGVWACDGGNVYGNGEYQTAQASNTPNINTSGNFISHIATSGSTTSGSTEFVVMLGTKGRNGNISNTTFVENLHVFRTPSTLVQSEVSGTSVTVNLNNGGFSQLYISANTTVDITNVRDGQSFSIKTRTNGNYTTTWTATGYTFQFEGGNNQPGNTVTDIFDFQVFGTVIYGSRKHNYS